MRDGRRSVFSVRRLRRQKSRSKIRSRWRRHEQSEPPCELSRNCGFTNTDSLNNIKHDSKLREKVEIFHQCLKEALRSKLTKKKEIHLCNDFVFFIVLLWQLMLMSNGSNLTRRV